MNFLKYVGAICLPGQQLPDPAATCTTYTRSEQTLLSASHSLTRLTPADDRGDITRETHYGSGKPSPRATHGKRDETSGQTRFKPTDDSSTLPQFCSHHQLPQAIPDHVTVSYECPSTQDTSRWETLAIHTVLATQSSVYMTE